MPARKIVHLDKPRPRNHSLFGTYFSARWVLWFGRDRVAKPQGSLRTLFAWREWRPPGYSHCMPSNLLTSGPLDGGSGNVPVDIGSCQCRQDCEKARLEPMPLESSLYPNEHWL